MKRASSLEKRDWRERESAAPLVVVMNGPAAVAAVDAATGAPSEEGAVVIGSDDMAWGQRGRL